MKQANLNIIFFALTIFMGCLSCEEQTEWTIQQGEPYLVVDAIITSELRQQVVTVSQFNQQLNGEMEMVTGATLGVVDGTNWYPFREKNGVPGVYHSDSFAVVVNKSYALLLEYKGFRDTAIAQAAPLAPTINDTIVKQEHGYRYIYRGSTLPAITEVQYDWSHNTNWCASYGSCIATEYFYTLNNIDVSEEFGPDKQIIYFPDGTSIYRKKYSLSDAHQQFIRSLLIETEWRGGLFDMEPGNVPSNFSRGTRGWFGACMVKSDTLFSHSSK